MTLTLEHEVLWLRDKKIIESGVTHAVLWPAYEFAVMSYQSIHQRDSDLNPFERAIIGLAENGISEIKRQAELLALDEDLVAHIHTSLVNSKKIDSDGKLRATRSATVDEEKIVAQYMYQDPWTGSMWPRSIGLERRQRLPAELEDGKPTLLVGTTGDPLKIRTFEVGPPESETNLPTSDDLVDAVRSWMKIESQQMNRPKGSRLNLRLKMSPKTKKLVYLVCPNQRIKNEKPVLEDPFGCPSWLVFEGQRKNLLQELPAFGRWLTGGIGTSLEESTDEIGLLERFRQLESYIFNAGSDIALSQVHQDLQDLSHTLLDQIIAGVSGRKQDVLNCLIDPLSDARLLEKLARVFGFDSDGLFTTKDDVKIYCETNNGTLVQKFAFLLLCFPPEDHGGLLYDLARKCSNFFNIVKITESNNRLGEKVKAQIQVLNHLFETFSTSVRS